MPSYTKQDLEDYARKVEQKAAEFGSITTRWSTKCVTMRR